MRGITRLLLMGLLVLTASYCSTAPGGERAEPTPQTTLVVENQSTLQVTVYVLRDSQRLRLGVANALSTTRLRIPDNMLFGPTALRFEIDPLGSRQTPISEQITVMPGEEVVLRVPSTVR